MDWIETFYELVNEYRHQFKMKVHTHQDYEGTRITITSGKDIIVRAFDTDYDHAHHRAYDDLRMYLDYQLKRIEEFKGTLAEFIKTNIEEEKEDDQEDGCA